VAQQERKHSNGGLDPGIFVRRYSEGRTRNTRQGMLRTSQIVRLNQVRDNRERNRTVPGMEDCAPKKDRWPNSRGRRESHQGVQWGVEHVGGNPVKRMHRPERAKGI